MSGYVVCASCGARIKANRERCLRCGEILQAASTPEPGRISLWLQGAAGRRLIIGVVGSLALFAIGGAYLDWQSPAIDRVARPAPRAGQTDASRAAPAEADG